MTDPIPIGIHYDIPERDYFADQALSQSGAKLLLDCPARFRYEQDHPSAPTSGMEEGTAIHALALGGKPAHVTIDADSWRTNKAKAAAAEARAAGMIPVLPPDASRIEATARAVREHEAVAPMLREGDPEVTLRWDDPTTGIACRGRVDWLTQDSTGVPVQIDLKTTPSVAGNIGKTFATYDYHMQAAHYTRGYEVLTGQPAAFIFVFVERSDPHFVRVIHADRPLLQQGRMAMDDALSLYARCAAADEWPAYPSLETVDLPPWAAGGAYA